MQFQVATALLVAGSTPTLWIPQFVSTSSQNNYTIFLFFQFVQIILFATEITWKLW